MFLPVMLPEKNHNLRDAISEDPDELFGLKKHVAIVAENVAPKAMIL